MRVRLYSFWRSSASHRVRIALALKGVEHEYVAVDLRAPGGGEQWSATHRARSPMGKVPVLEVDEGADDVKRVTESMAIIEWLEDLFPEPPLLPADPYLRARARMLAEMVNSGIQPFQNTSVQKYVASLGLDPEGWARHWVGLGVAALEAAVGETAGRFSVGDAVSLADLYVVPQLAWARRFGVDLSGAPTLARIDAECAKLPAFAAAAPDRQPDARPPAE